MPSITQIELDHPQPPLQEYRGLVLDVFDLKEEELLDVLATHFLTLEHQYLREPRELPQMPAEAKILFLIGPETGDVTDGRDFDGNPIHTRVLAFDRPKFPEIQEALGAISRWFDRAETASTKGESLHNVASVIGEVCDVVYCLTHLTTLDQTSANQYMQYIQMLANSSGMTVRDLLLITCVKYNYRLGRGESRKNIDEETILIDQLLTQSNEKGYSIAVPQAEQLKGLFRSLNQISVGLKSRLDMLRINHVIAASGNSAG